MEGGGAAVGVRNKNQGNSEIGLTAAAYEAGLRREAEKTR